MNVIRRLTAMLGKEEWGPQAIVDKIGKQLKDERSKLLWNKITH